MKLVFTKTLANNVYTVEVAVTEVAAEDLELFADFGEPSIDIGGTIMDTDDTTILATLPSNFRKVHSQMPIVSRFGDAQFSSKGKVIAEAWIRMIEKRINQAMTDIRLKLDDFSGTQESII